MSTATSVPLLSTVAAVLQCTVLVDQRFSRRMVSSGMSRRVALVRTDVSEELSASFIRATRIGKLGTTLAVTC
jgi:hypothetical protein